MASTLQHRNTRIVTLDAGETPAAVCRSGDIALMPEGSGWSVHFVGDDGEIDSYDEPFDSYNKALWSAKAAAEFGDGAAE